MTATRAAALAAWIGALCILGCKNGGGGTSSGDGGSGGGNGGANGTGGSGTGGGSGKLGAVTVLQQNVSGAWTGVISAVFYESEGVPAQCTHTTEGDCVVDDCTYPTPHGPTPVLNRSAGAVSVMGVLEPHMLTPNADETYTTVVTGRLWNEGDTISFDVAGDVVPALSGSVVGVAELALVSPDFAAGSVDIERGVDLPIKWNGGHAGSANVSVTHVVESGGTSHAVAISCRYPAGDGSGVVPAAALARVPAGTGGSLAFFARDVDFQSVGGWDITLSSLGSNVASAATFH